MEETPEPEYLTAAEAAQLLRTSRKALYAMVARGGLPGIRRVGRRLLVHRRTLLRFLEESCAASPPKGAP